MPNLLLATRFSTRGTIDDDDLATVRDALAAGTARLKLSHRESFLGIEIDRTECVRGGFDLRLEGNSLVTEADFTAKIKISKSNAAEILGAEDRTWFSRGVTTVGRIWSNDGGDATGAIEIPVEIAEPAAPGGKAGKRDAASGPPTVLRWRIDRALADLEGTDPEPPLRELYRRTVADLEKGEIDPDEAGERIQPALTFEFNSENLDRRKSIRKIVAPSALEDGEFLVVVSLDRGNSEVTAEAVDGELAITAEITVPITLRAGVSAADATEWLQENGGEFGGYLGPFSWHHDAGQSIGVEAKE